MGFFCTKRRDFDFPLEIRFSPWYNKDMSNALEFIAAYNAIDARMRALYKGKGTLGFSDLVRRLAPMQSVLGKYEDELVAFARLRNAIVHNTTTDRVIAEPTDEATALICRIANLITAPPKLKELKKKAPVVGIESHESIAKAAKLIAKTGYSNLPVYQNGRFIGIVNNRSIVRALGEALARGESADAFLKQNTKSLLSEKDSLYYKVLRSEDTVEDAIDAFTDNRRLLAVIVKDGKGEIQKILTPIDIPKLISLMDGEV